MFQSKFIEISSQNKNNSNNFQKIANIFNFSNYSRDNKTAARDIFNTFAIKLSVTIVSEERNLDQALGFRGTVTIDN